LIQPHGKSYVGDFVEGLREGNGVMTWSNGDRYEGGWKQDKVYFYFLEEKKPTANIHEMF